VKYVCDCDHIVNVYTNFHSVVAKGFNLWVYEQTKTEQSRLMELKESHKF
jgi:hypothetical protein